MRAQALDVDVLAAHLLREFGKAAVDVGATMVKS
jgi:hypothetical protein